MHPRLAHALVVLTAFLGYLVVIALIAITGPNDPCDDGRRYSHVYDCPAQRGGDTP